MLVSNPNLARYSDAYGRQLFLNTAMFGDRGQLRALSHNLSRFGTVENPAPFAEHTEVYAAASPSSDNVAPPAKFAAKLAEHFKAVKKTSAVGWSETVAP